MEPDQRIAQILAHDFDVLFKPMARSALNQYMGIGVDFYGKPFRAVIMLWPDANNILPTENGYDDIGQEEAMTLIDEDSSPT